MSCSLCLQCCSPRSLLSLQILASTRPPVSTRSKVSPSFHVALSVLSSSRTPTRTLLASPVIPAKVLVNDSVQVWTCLGLAASLPALMGAAYGDTLKVLQGASSQTGPTNKDFPQRTGCSPGRAGAGVCGAGLGVGEVLSLESL